MEPPLLGTTCLACVRGLAGVPFAFTLRFDAGAINQEVQRAGSATIRQAHVQRSLAAASGAEIRHCPVQTDQPQQALDETRGLPERHTKPKLHPLSGHCVAMPCRAVVRQAWIAASLNSCCRPRLPVGGGVQVISRSNKIESDPRCFSAVLYESQFRSSTS
jgi:hypothetical protein